MKKEVKKTTDFWRDLEKTRELLNERRKQNREAGYGRPIPDITWNEVSKEIADCERKLANYRTLSIGLVLIIIFISSYLLL